MTGFIVVDKEQGASSAQEVNRIKRLLNAPCGHMGTLDPMATGVLPVAIGNAARLFDFFLDKHKTYVADFRFGIDSDTLDTTGEMRLNAGYVPSKQQIEAELYKFEGEVEQLPPKFSAKNINGKRGYQLAREGIEFQLKAKKVNIYSIVLINQTEEDTFRFKIECGGGTYIRSIARDLGAGLGTCAVMSALVRTASGVFSLESSVKTRSLTTDNIQNFIIPTESVLPYEAIVPTPQQAKKLFNGLSVQCDKADGVYKIYSADGSFYGLAEVSQSVLKVGKKLC